MKLSRTVTYALHASILLVESDQRGPIPCSRLADTGKMPERFLLQVLRSLVTRGILESTRGVEGGYTLRRDPDELTLLEIIEAVDGPIQASVPDRNGIPESLRETLTTIATDVAQHSREYLGAIPLSRLVTLDEPNALNRPHLRSEKASEAPKQGSPTPTAADAPHPSSGVASVFPDGAHGDESTGDAPTDTA